MRARAWRAEEDRREDGGVRGRQMESWKVHLREKKKPGKEEEEVKNQQVEDLAGGERQGCEPAAD